MATSHSGTLVATACKSTTTEHAVLRLYNTNDWKLVGEPLGGHTLTVTRISFSPDDSMILSVSRDRTWRLFHATDGRIFNACVAKAQGKNLVQVVIHPLPPKNATDESFGIVHGQLRIQTSRLPRHRETKRFA